MQMGLAEFMNGSNSEITDTWNFNEEPASFALVSHFLLDVRQNEVELERLRLMQTDESELASLKSAPHLHDYIAGWNFFIKVSRCGFIAAYWYSCCCLNCALRCCVSVGPGVKWLTSHLLSWACRFSRIVQLSAATSAQWATVMAIGQDRSRPGGPYVTAGLRKISDSSSDTALCTQR